MADLTFTVQALDKAVGTLLKVMAAVEKVGKSVDRLDGRIAKIGINADGAEKTERAIDNVDRKMKGLDGKKATVKVDVDKSVSDSLIQVTRLGSALRALALPAAGIAAAPQIAALGAALVSATGAIGIVPGVAGAAFLAINTLKVGFLGFGDAMKNVGDPKKFAEDIAKLTPAARQTAVAIRDLVQGPLKQLREVVQERLFAGMANQVRGLAATFLPALQREMDKVARSVNVSMTSVFSFLRRGDVARDIQGILISLRVGVQNVVIALRPMAQAFVDIFATSAARIPALTKGVSDLALRFATFINNARQTGQLGAWIDKGIQTVGLLGRTVTNVGSILMSVFRAATSEGANLVQRLADITGQVAAFLKSAQGQSSIGAVFAAIAAAVEALRSAFGPLVPILVEVVRIVGANLVAVFQALSGPLNAITTALAQSLAPVLPRIAEAFRQIALAIVPMIAPVLALIPAFDSIARVLTVAAEVAAKFFTGMAVTGSAAFTAIVPLIRAAADTLTLLLQVIEPIAPALGAVVAAFLMFRTVTGVIGTAQALLTGFAAKIAESALNAGVFTEKITGSAAAGEKLAVAGGRLSGALGAVSTALPIIAVAAVAASLAYEQMRDKSDELATAVVRGQQTMTAAVAEQSSRLQEQSMVMDMLQGEGYATGQAIGDLTGQFDANTAAADHNAQAQAAISTQIEQQISGLPPLEAAQVRVRLAQEAWNEAVRLHGPYSDEAASAANTLRDATDREKVAQQQAADATKSHTDRITEQTVAAAGAADADIALQQATLRTAEAQDRAREAIEKHGASSREAQRASLDLTQANLAEAQAAGRKAQADAEASGASDGAARSARAYADKLIELASQATGPTRAALLGYIANLDTTKSGANNAALAAVGLKDDINRIPVGHETKVTTPGLAEARSGIQGLTREILNIQGKTVDIFVTALGKGGLASAGRLATGGILPGYTPGRDVHTFVGAPGTLDLSGGEAIMRPEWTRAVGPEYVHAANRAARQGGIPAVTGFLARTAPRRQGEGVRGDGSRFASGGVYGRFASGGVAPVVARTTYRDQVPAMQERIDSVFGAAAMKLGQTAYEKMGGPALAWARTQVGKPYIWGGVGPAGYDCSGFMSAVLNVMQGRPPHSRRGATGNFPWPGFSPGLGGLFSIGAFRGNPGHMAGTLAGTNVESSGGVGVRVGGGARGASNSMFNIRAHIGDTGGMLRSGEAVINLSGGLERVLSAKQTQAFETILSAVSTARGGAGGGELLSALRTVSAQLHALRGDVDHHSDNAGIAARLDVTNRLLASAASGSSADSAQRGRVIGDLGPF